MKVYLINPLFEPSIWRLQNLMSGAAFIATPLGLATVAALTPKHWKVEIADENVEPIDFDTDADLVGMGPFNVQYVRHWRLPKSFGNGANRLSSEARTAASGLKGSRKMGTS